MPSDPRDYRVTLSGRAASSASKPKPAVNGPMRPFIGVTFNCCRVYVRVHRSADVDQYVARCPRCGKSVRFVVGEGGTDARTFVVE
jgi:PHP family Zn ribbon phosphoesterase